MKRERSRRRETDLSADEYQKLPVKEFDNSPCNGCSHSKVSSRGGITDTVGYYCSYGPRQCVDYGKWLHRRMEQATSKQDGRVRDLEDRERRCSEYMDKMNEEMERLETRWNELTVAEKRCSAERVRLENLESELIERGKSIEVESQRLEGVAEGLRGKEKDLVEISRILKEKEQMILEKAREMGIE